MFRNRWVKTLFGRTNRPTRKTRPGSRPILLHLEDRTAPATLTEAGTVLTIDLDTAGELLTAVSQGAKYQFTTSAVFTDGGVTAGNFTGLGTNTVTLDNPAAYTEIRFTDSQPGGTVRFDDSGGNPYVQPFTVTVDGAGAVITFAGTTDFGANALNLTAAGPIKQTGGNLTAGLLSATGSFVDIQAGTNTFAQLTGAATAGRFDLIADSDLTVVAPGLAATDTVALTLSAGKTLTVNAPIAVGTGNVELVADDFVLNAGLQAPFPGADISQGNVVLLTAATGRPITFAAAPVAGTLSVSAAELALLTAGRLVQIGDSLAGDLTVSQGITAPAGFSKLILGSGKTLTQAAAAPIVVGALGLFLDVNATQTATLTAPGNAIGRFAVEAKDTTDITLANTGDLAVGKVDSISGIVGQTVSLTTSGKLTLEDSVTASKALTLTAGGKIAQTGGQITTVALVANGTAVDLQTATNKLSTLTGSATAGRFDLFADTDLEVVAPGLTATDSVALTQSAGKTLTVNAPITSTTGNVELVADDFVINAALSAPTVGVTIEQGNVVLLTAGPARKIAIAAAPVAGSLSVSKAEIGLLTAGRLVQIGDPLAGDLAITQGFTAPAGSGKVILGTGGNLTQAAGAAVTVNALGLFLDKAGTQTVTLTAPGNSLGVFAAEASPTTDITIANFGDLTVDKVGSIPGVVAQNLTIGTIGKLTLANTVSVAQTFKVNADGAVVQTAGTVAAGLFDVTAASVDVALAGNAIGKVFGTAATGGFVVTTDTDLEVIAPGVTAVGTVTLTAGKGKTVTVNADVLSKEGNAEIFADDAAINAKFQAPFAGVDNAKGNVYLLVTTAGRKMAIAAAPVAGRFSVSAAEFAKLTAGRLVQLGDNIFSGDIVITQGFTAPNDANGKFTRFLIGSFENITQDAGAGIVVPEFGIFLATGGDQTATLTAAGNKVTVFAGEGDSDDITFTSTGPLTIGTVGTVVGLTGKNLTVTAASPLVVANDVIGAANVTLTATDSAAVGDDLTVNAGVTVRSKAGTVTLRAGDDLILLAGATLKADAGKVDAFIDFGNADAGVGAKVDTTKAVLFATAGVFLTGGPDPDEFTVSGSADAAIFVDGQAPSLPTFPGDKLNFVATGGAVTFTPGVTPDKGTIDETGKKSVSFVEIETLNLGGIVFGTNNDDILVLFKVGPDTFYTLNGAPKVAVIADQFKFFGLAGADTFVVDFSGGNPVPAKGAFFDGTDKANDKACFLGAVGFTAAYRPDAAVEGKGTVTVNASVIEFVNTNGIDIISFDKATLFTQNADDTLEVADGLTFCKVGNPAALQPALRATGTSGAKAITPVAFRGNGTLVIDPDTESAGIDVVTVKSAVGDHQNKNLTITTGGGADKVNFTGPATVVGDVLVVSKDITVAADVTAGGAITFTNSGTLQFSTVPVVPVTVSGAKGVTQNGAGPVLLIGKAVVQSAAGPVSFAKGIDAAPGNNGSLTIVAPDAAAGVVTLSGSVGTNRRPDELVITAGNLIRIQSVEYKTLGIQTYNGPVSVEADATFEAVTGAIGFLGTVDGAKNVTVTTPGDTTFAKAVGGTTALTSLTTNGGGTTFVNGGLVKTTGDQTYADAVQVGAATTFTAGGKVSFNGTLDGAVAVTVTAAGLTTFAGKVGGAAPLASLTTNGGSSTAVNGGLVKTTGFQQYDDAVTVGADALFAAGGDVRFNNTLDGGFNVTVTAAGDTVFAQAVGGGTPLASLVTNGGGVTKVGGPVTTTGGQTYDDPVQVTADGETTFAATAKGDVRFNAGLTGATADVKVNTTGESFFAGGVTVKSLTTDAGGTTRVAGGTVAATNDLKFGDPVVVDAPTTFTSANGNIAFNSTLTGNAVTVNVAATKTITFGGAVSVVSLTTNAADGKAIFNGKVVTATGGDLTFNTNVEVGEDTTFAGKNVTFNGTLTGTGKAVAVNSAGDTTFNNTVAVGSLTTDAGGRTVVNKTTVTTTGGQTYGDEFRYTGAVTLTSTGGKAITFNGPVTAPAGAELTVNTAGDTVFNGPVSAAKLTTDKDGRTLVNTPTFTASGPVVFGDPVVVQQNVTFTTTGAATPLTFGSTLDGGFDVTVTTTGLAKFVGKVGGATPLTSLTLTAGGLGAEFNGGLVKTTGPQKYLTNVTATVPTTFAAGGTITIGAAFTGTGEIVFDAKVPGGLAVLQLAGSKLTIPDQKVGDKTVLGLLTLRGTGEFRIDSPENGIGAFQATIDQGPIFLSTAGNLTLAAEGVTANGGDVRIRTGGDFTALAGATKVALNPANQFVVYFGLDGTGATATFTADITARRLVIGRPDEQRKNTKLGDPDVLLPDGTTFKSEQSFLPGLPVEPAGTPAFQSATNENDQPDLVVFRPSATTPFFLFGNRPFTGVSGDTFQPVFDVAPSNFQIVGNAGVDGFFEFIDPVTKLAARQKVEFRNFEGFGGLSQTAFVVQTGEPGDGSGFTTQQYAVRVIRTQNGVSIPGGLAGQRLPENPFVVFPAQVNPAAPTQPPRVTLGLIDGDTIPDLILANGPGTPPLVTIINGRAFDQVFENGQPRARRIEELAGLGLILAQFYAFEPTFQGGLNVAVGNLDGSPDGKLEIIVGAETGGGPRVRVFSLRDRVADPRVGSSRVDLQACKLEYSIVSPK